MSRSIPEPLPADVRPSPERRGRVVSARGRACAALTVGVAASLVALRCAHANVPIPILDLFSAETAWLAGASFFVAVMVEGWYSLRHLPALGARRALWVSLMANVASSSAGSLLALFAGPLRVSFHPFSVAIWTLFLATIVIESAVVAWAIPEQRGRLRRLIFLVVKANALSYVLLFFCIPVFAFVGGSVADDAFAHRPSDAGVPGGTEGIIVSNNPDGGLRQWATPAGPWNALDWLPPLEDAKTWDASSDVLATVHAPAASPWKRGVLALWRTSERKKIVDIAGDFCAVAISPDEVSVAALREWPVAVRGSPPGRVRRNVQVFELATGRLTAETSAPALDSGIAWTSDSSRVLFTCPSPTDTTDGRAQQPGTVITKKLRNAEDLDSPPHVCALTMSGAGIRDLGPGAYPVRLASNRQVAVLVGERPWKIVLLDPDSFSRTSTGLELTEPSYAFDPSGSRIVAFTRRKAYPARHFFLTMSTVDDGDSSFLLDPIARVPRVVWVPARGQ